MIGGWLQAGGRGSTALGLMGVLAWMAGALADPPMGPVSWPDKDGPTFNRVAKGGDAANLPVEWDEKTKKNIAWKIKLEGEGHSTPVIGWGLAWFTSASEDGKKQYVYAVDINDGSIKHHKLLFENKDPEPLGNEYNNYAAPSCVLQDDAVYVHFGTYGTARLDRKTAQVVWKRRDINVRHFRGPGSSPVLYKNLLILTFDGIDQQFLIALDKETGKTEWKTKRTTDFKDLGPDGKPFREGDLRKAYSTPAIVPVDDIGHKHHVVSVGSRAAFGYDADTGVEIWTVPHKSFNAAARPMVIDDNLVIINTGSKGAESIAIRCSPEAKGDLTGTKHIEWRRPKKNARLSSPVVWDKHYYFATDNGVAYCLDALTGKELWKGRLGGSHVASPLIANGLVYFFDDHGVTYVVKPDDKLNIVAKNHLDEGMKASAAVARGAFFLRTYHHLYKIAKKE